MVSLWGSRQAQTRRSCTCRAAIIRRSQESQPSPLCGLHASVGTCPLFSNRCLPVEAGLQGLHPCKPSFAYKHLLAPDCFLETFEAFGL